MSPLIIYNYSCESFLSFCATVGLLLNEHRIKRNTLKRKVSKPLPFLLSKQIVGVLMDSDYLNQIRIGILLDADMDTIISDPSGYGSISGY